MVGIKRKSKLVLTNGDGLLLLILSLSYFKERKMDRKVSNILPPIIAGLISVIVNYGGTFILIFQAAQMAGLNPEQTASWVWSISIGVGITGIILSLYTKEPIITAWSTPAAAFLVTAIATVSYSEVIASYIYYLLLLFLF